MIDRHRLQWTWVLLAGGGLLACAGADNGAPPPAPGEAVAGLGPGERGRFLLGRALFERVATADEGLGPLYNADRCSSCHDQPTVGGGGTAILVVKATRFADGKCDPLRSSGGDNIQQRATGLLVDAGMGSEEIPEAATHTALVTAPPLLGMGLIEAVPDEAIEGWADPNDMDGDGISGRVARLADGRLARFGRKGDAHSVVDFVDSALRFELGFTTPGHTTEETWNGVPIPPGADPMADPEIDAPTLALLADYVRLLAPPSPERGLSATAQDTVSQGAALFRQIGCSACHREELHTAGAEFEALANRAIQPFSDLLLHDLGPGLADVCGPVATPSELRTAPLWGLRYRDKFLHDGRAENLFSAVSAHGGEAESARDSFMALPDGARASLLRFLRSL